MREPSNMTRSFLKNASMSWVRIDIKYSYVSKWWSLLNI